MTQVPRYCTFPRATAVRRHRRLHRLQLTRSHMPYTDPSVTLQVFELGLFSALRNVLIGGPAERKAIASAGTATHLKPTPGRQGAILGCWELALTVRHALTAVHPLLDVWKFCVFACLRVCACVRVRFNLYFVHLAELVLIRF